MAQRIIQETLSDKTVQYRVETNRRLGFIPCKWYTDSQLIGPDCYGPAIFSNLDDAKNFIGIHEVKYPNVVDSKIILISK